MKPITFIMPDGTRANAATLTTRDGKTITRKLYGYKDTRQVHGSRGCMVNYKGWQFLPDPVIDDQRCPFMPGYVLTNA